MTLLITVYRHGPTGTEILRAENHAHELGGFERFRTTFYGGATARSLGLRLLPTLAAHDLYVENDQLDELEREANNVLNSIELFEVEADADVDLLRYRVENVLRAIARARAENANVVIW